MYFNAAVPPILFFFDMMMPLKVNLTFNMWGNYLLAMLREELPSERNNVLLRGWYSRLYRVKTIDTSVNFTVHINNCCSCVPVKSPSTFQLGA